MITKSLGSLTKAELDSCVRCYQFVFAGKPWDEWKICRICGRKWGINDGTRLEEFGHKHCGQSIELFWPSEVVLDDLRHIINKPTDCSLVAVDQCTVIGFCLGYGIATVELEQHLGIEICSKIEGDTLVAYQDDLGVLQAYRRQGVAHMLFQNRQQAFRKFGLETDVVRTLKSPPSVTHTWYSRLGYQEIAEYHDGRVIMTRSLSDLSI